MTTSRAHHRRDPRAATSPRRAYLRAATVAIAAVAPAALWAAPGCVLDGFKRVPDRVVEEEQDAAASNACTHVSYPAPPTSPAEGDDITFTVALRTIDLGEEPGSLSVGIDLDDTCTCLGEGPSCQPVLPDAAPPVCDTNGGRDNVGTKLFKFLRTAAGAGAFGSTFFSQQAEQGKWSVILRVRGYNGQPDDGKVQLDWFIAPGFNGLTPAWQGNDAWPVQPDHTIENDINRAQYTDPAAYVSNYMLVAALPEVPIRLGGAVSSIEILLSGAFVLAEIGRQPEVGDAYVLKQGTLVGRWTLAELFRSIGSYRSDTGEPFCTDGFFYGAAKTELCASADILSKPGSPTATCDSLSLGIGFTSFPAQISGVYTPPPPEADAGPVEVTSCPPETDPANDACDKP